MINRICIPVLFFLIFAGTAIAQQQHFIFIQSENRQPFNVKLSRTNFSSSANGYLVIPKLTDGEYAFTVGFAGNSIADQTFYCVVDKKDIGFTLKQFGDKGWGLFNLQTFEIIMANQKPAVTAKPAVNTPEPAVNTNPANSKPDVEKEKPKDTVAIAVTKVDTKSNADSARVVTEPPVTKIQKTDSVKQVIVVETPKTQNPLPPANTANQSKYGVYKNGTADFSTGLQLTFVEVEANFTDTVRAFIPYQPATPTNDTPVKPDAAKVIDTAKKVYNTNCLNLAADDDFFKLRRKMSSESEDEPMIQAAKKVFKTKCFTVQQIKNLSTLFLNDKGRYQFFEAAYPFAYDVFKFKTLQSELTDNQFIQQFIELTQSK